MDNQQTTDSALTKRRVTPGSSSGAFVESCDGKNWVAIAYFDDIWIDGQIVPGSGIKLAENYVLVRMKIETFFWCLTSTLSTASLVTLAIVAIGVAARWW